MSAIDEENKDKEGFLCIAYSREEKGVCVSYEELWAAFSDDSLYPGDFNAYGVWTVVVNGFSSEALG